MQYIECRNCPVSVPWFYTAHTWLQYKVIPSRAYMLPKEGRHLDKLTPANLRIEKKKVANEISSENIFLEFRRGCSCSSGLEGLPSRHGVLGSIANAWQNQNQTKVN